MKKNKINYRLIVKAVLLILFAFFAVGIYQILTYIPGVREAVVLATTVKQETFTELYFSNHQELPQKVDIYKPITFTFTIHNLEDSDMNYSYEVFVSEDGNKNVVLIDHVEIKKNEYKTISETLSTGYSKRYKVGISLLNKNNQSIDFWVN